MNKKLGTVYKDSTEIIIFAELLNSTTEANVEPITI
jgi:hypothetical protein